MTFIGEPNQLIFTIQISGIQRKRVCIGKFDENGEFKTKDDNIIKKMKQHFPIKPRKGVNL